MDDLDLISEARVEVSSTGMDETAAKATSLGSSIEGLVVSQDKLSAAQIRVNRALETTAKKYDAEYRALTELQRATNLLERAQVQGLSGTEAYARIQSNVTLKLQAQAEAARQANEAQQKLAATARSQAQASINTATGVRSEFGTADRGADIAAYAAELDRLREKFVPVFAMSQQYARAQEEVADALRVGAISANEAAEAQLRLTRTYEDQTQKLERLGQARKESAQRSVNSQLIVPDRGGDIAAYAAELNALQAEFDPLFAAEQKYEAGMERVQRALEVGGISQAVFNARVAEMGAALDEAVAKLSGLAAAQEAASQSSKRAVAAQAEFNTLLGVKTDFGTDNRAADIEAFGQALSDTRARYDPVYRAQQLYVTGLKELRAALASGAIDTDIFSQRLSEQKAAFTEVAASLGMMTAKQREYAEASQAAARVSQIQGVKENVGEDALAYAQSLDEAAARVDLLYGAERELKRSQAEINALFEAGVISAEAQAKALDRAAGRFNNQKIEIEKAEQSTARLTKGVGLNAYQWQNLSFQINDVITSLTSGIGVVQTVAQQGGQIFQILQTAAGGVTGALKSILEAFLRINPLIAIFGTLAVAAGGVALALYNSAKASRDVELGLLGVGAGAGLTADQIGIIAIQASKTAQITVGAAREIELAFLKSGKVAAEAFLPGTVAVANYARKNGVSNSDAASTVAQNLTELGEGGYEKLAKEAGNFDVILEAQVRSLLNAGNQAEAQRLVIERFAEAYAKAGEKLTWFERAMNAVKSGASNLSDAVSRGVNGTVEIPEQLERVEAAIRTRKKLSVATGVDVDTSDLDAKRDKIKADIAKLGEDAAQAAKKVKTNLEGLKRDAVNAVVPQLADLKKVRDQIEQNNGLISAIENAPKPSDPETAKRYKEDLDAAIKTQKGLTAAERDYAAAGGPANLEREKGNRLLKAKFAMEAARTPAQRQAAAVDQVEAENFGTKLDQTERDARKADAAKKALQEYAVASKNASDAQVQQTTTANVLADATAKGANKSVEAIAAQRKVEEDIDAGRTDAAEKNKKVREQLENQLSGLNKAAADRVKAAQIEAQGRETANASIEKGGRSAADAARRIAGENEVRKLRVEAMAAEGEAAQNLTQRSDELAAAQNRQISAEDKAKLLTLAEDEQRKIDLLMEESRLLGENTRERQARLIVLQAEQSLKKDGIDPTSAAAQPYLDKVRMRADLDTAKQEYERLASDISSAVSGIFDDMFKKGNKGFAGFADSFSKGFSRIGTRLLEQNIIAPLIGGQGLDGKGGGLEKLFSGFGKIFDTDKVEKAVSSGSESGTASGFLSIFKPKSGGASNGAFSMGGLGGGVLAAGAGASIGYQSQSPLMGVLGGALTGAATPLGPLGAVIGAGAGLLGGLFGASQAKKEAKKKLQQELQARKEALEQARPQIEQLDAMLSGNSIGNLGKNISDALSQVKAAAKTASDGGDRALADKLVRDFEAYVARQTAVFARGFEGVLAEVQAGFGTGGAFSTALGAVQTLGDALKGFVADAGRLTDPAAQQRARAAAVEGALSSVEAPKTLSSTQTELQRINGTAAGLTQVLLDLGLSAEQAAAAIKDRTTKALDALASKFNDDLDRKINGAKGKDYLNDASDLIKEVGSLNADAASLGQDGGKVDNYFSAAAQKIVDSSQLAGDAFNELIGAFPELAGRVHEYTEDSKKSAAEMAKAAADALAAIQDRKRAYEDRYVEATLGGNNDLWSKTTVMARNHEWEQWTESAKGGQAMDYLLQAQQAEYEKMIRDYNQAVNDRRQAFGSRQLSAQSDGSLGSQLNLFDRNAQQERLEEVRNGGDALVQLEAAQAAERWKIVKEYYDRVNDRIRAFNDRAFAATNNENTLAGKLAAFQRAAAQQQLEEAKAGGEAMAALYAAQGAEQQKIINDYYRAVRDRQAGFQDRAFAAGSDASSLAGQLATFERQAQKDRAAELEIGGEAMLDLTRAQEAERAKIVRDYYEAVNQRILSFQDRLFAATNTSDLGGQLAAFDRAAAAERLAEIKTGGEALTALMAAQNAERQKLIDEYNRAIAERRSGYQDRAFSAANDNGLNAQLAAFERAAQKERADEIKAGGEAILDLTIAQEAERAKIIRDYYEQVRTRIGGYQDRLFAATTDANTLAGQLAAFDRRSAAERAEEVKAGGEGLAYLEAAQYAERLKVIEDFNKQAKAAFDDFANTIKKFLEQMLAGSASPLSPEARLKAAQSQYDEQLKLAQGGDKTALGSITSYAQTLLDAGKAYYASSQAFQDVFQQIYDQLGKLPEQVGQQAFGDTASGTGSSALTDSVTKALAAQYLQPLGASNDDMASPAASSPAAMATPSNQGAALLAELKAIGARLDALRGDVKENTEVTEEGALQEIAELKSVGAALSKGNRDDSRREVA
jgi:hypothetical protein